MVRRYRLSWGVCLAWALTATGAWGDEIVALGVGSQKVLTVPGLSRIAVGDPSIADVKTLGNNQVLVIGAGEEKTTLLIWKGNGQRVSYLVTVRKQDPNEVISEIRRLLGDIEGVSVKLVGDRIYLEGEAWTSLDADRIDQVVGLYPSVKSFVKVALNARKLEAQNLNQVFQREGLRNVQANVVGSTIFLEGSVESQQDLQKAELITRALGEKVENLLVVGIKRMILSEVQFVEVRAKDTDRYGIKYPTDLTGTATATLNVAKELWPGTLSQGAGILVGTASSSFSIGFQSNDGSGRLLAQPRLVCASGEKAEFVAGGEIPIPLITANSAAVDYKPYGIILKLRPTADRYGNIQTEIEAEVSEIDTSVAVSFGGSSQVPGFRTRKVRTNVTVRHGQTIVLSGVFSHDQQKAVSQLPGLAQIPIIGELFKDRAIDSSKRELVIFVTPRVVNPDSERVRDLIEDMKSRYKQARKDVTFDIFD